MFRYMHDECDDIDWKNLSFVDPNKSAKALLRVVQCHDRRELYNGKHVEYGDVADAALE